MVFQAIISILKLFLEMAKVETEWMPETPPHAEIAPEVPHRHSGASLAAALRGWFDSHHGSSEK